MTAADRYERQRRFPPFGEAGQRRVADARVAILGCGALGSVAAEVLARAGVGRLDLIDRDTVEWSNLQRQALYGEADAVAGRAKADAAATALREMNSTIEIVPHVTDLTVQNIDALLAKSNLVIDGTDNFATRFLLNDYSLEHQLPWVHGGCVGAMGQVALFRGLGQPCFRCFVPEPPHPATVQTCDTAGVIGAATHTIASLQAMTAIRFLSTGEAIFRDKTNAVVSSFDLWEGRVRQISIEPGDCPTCVGGRRDFLHGTRATTDQAATLCGRNAVQVAGDGATVDLESVGRRWHALGKVQRNPFFVRLSLNDAAAETVTITLFRDGRAVIGGTEDLAIARSLYARYVGA